MKNGFGLWLLAGAGGLSITGCCCSDSRMEVATLSPPQPVVVEYQPAVMANPADVNPRNEVIIVDPPPQLRVEIVNVQPLEARVWVAGHWTRTDTRWIWIPGHDEIWARPGMEEATAVGGVAD